MHTNIGVRLKEIRKKNKLKQTQMAEIAHCSLRNYQNIESGKTQPGYGILYNIVHGLPLNPRDLFALTLQNDARAEKTQKLLFLSTQLNDSQLSFLCSVGELLIKMETATQSEGRT